MGSDGRQLKTDSRSRPRQTKSTGKLCEAWRRSARSSRSGMSWIRPSSREILRLLIGGATKPRPSPLYSGGVYCRMSPLIGGNLPAPQFSPVIPAWNALGARGGRRKRASRAADWSLCGLRCQGLRPSRRHHVAVAPVSLAFAADPRLGSVAQVRLPAARACRLPPARGERTTCTVISSARITARQSGRPRPLRLSRGRLANSRGGSSSARPWRGPPAKAGASPARWRSAIPKSWPTSRST
jgi:hypothetical protein